MEHDLLRIGWQLTLKTCISAARSKTRTFVLIEAGASIAEPSIAAEWRGYAFYVCGETNECIMSDLALITGNQAFELPKFLRAARPDVIDDYLKCIHRINQQMPHPWWQACDLAAKDTSRLTYIWVIFCILSNIDEVLRISANFDGFILANLPHGAIDVLQRAFQGAGLNVQAIKAKWSFRTTLLFRGMRHFKNSISFVWTFARRTQKIKANAPRPMPCTESPEIKIWSYGFGRSFNANGYQDSYFGPLVTYLAQAKGLVPRWIINFYDPLKNFPVNVSQAEPPIDFAEHHLTFLNLLEIVLRLPFVWLSIYSAWAKKPLLFSRHNSDVNFNVTELFQNEVDELFSTPGIYYPITQYFIGRALGRQETKDVILYPFENLCWERMFLKGLRSSKRSLKIFGFQHSLLIPAFLPTRLAEQEYLDADLPDGIFTTGELAAEVMHRVAHYPKKMLLPGSALRQKTGLGFSSTRKPKNQDINLLVLLNTLQDSIGVLRFLQRANLQTAKIKSIALRFHPLFGEDVISKYVKVPKVRPYRTEGPVSLETSAADADVLLYCGSSAAAECLMLLGKPIIFLDLNDVADYDVLSQMTALKRVATDPKDLESAILELASLTDEAYLAEARVAKIFLERYFYPQTTEGLERFTREIIRHLQPKG